ACPWLVRRFIDPEAEFLYVPSAEVQAVAARTGAVPYNVAEAEFGHVGERCSFDAFIRLYGISDRALDRLALIVRGADTGRPARAVAGPVGEFRRRSCDAGAGHGALRCALCLVPGTGGLSGMRVPFSTLSETAIAAAEQAHGVSFPEAFRVW